MFVPATRLLTAAALAIAAAALFAGTLCAQDGPEQPLPFSHKSHAADLKLPCKMCHPNPNPGDAMTIVKPDACMQCHSAIKTDSLAIQTLAQYAKDDKEIPWVRIYRVPAYVNFSHRTHLSGKATCEPCHGKVAERDRLYLEVRLTMKTCIDCHADNGGGIDCGYCHKPR